MEVLRRPRTCFLSSTTRLKLHSDRHIRKHEEIYKHTLVTRLEALQAVRKILEIAKRMDL